MLQIIFGDDLLHCVYMSFLIFKCTAGKLSIQMHEKMLLKIRSAISLTFASLTQLPTIIAALILTFDIG